jgi:hypothetical protein
LSLARQTRRVVDGIRLETVDVRAVGQSMMDVTAHVLVTSMERTGASGDSSPGDAHPARALAAANTSECVLRHWCTNCVVAPLFPLSGLLHVRSRVSFHARACVSAPVCALSGVGG